MDEQLLDELFERLADLKERKANYFDGGDFHEGDRGYQDILEAIDETQEQIDEIIEKDEDTT